MDSQNPFDHFSFSGLSHFFQCAWSWKLNYVDGQHPTGAHFQTNKGGELHKLYEAVSVAKLQNNTELLKEVKKGFSVKFPLEYAKYLKVWSSLESGKIPIFYKDEKIYLPIGNNLYFEKEFDLGLTLPSSGLKTKLTGHIDYLNLNDPECAWIVDYKSGKHAGDATYKDQMAIYALLIFGCFKKVKNIKAFLFDVSDNMKQGIVNSEIYEFSREGDVELLAQTILKQIDIIYNTVRTKKYVKTPCFKCRYCPDTSCVHNRNSELKQKK